MTFGVMVERQQVVAATSVCIACDGIFLQRIKRVMRSFLKKLMNLYLDNFLIIKILDIVN